MGIVATNYPGQPTPLAPNPGAVTATTLGAIAVSASTVAATASVIGPIFDSGGTQYSATAMGLSTGSGKAAANDSLIVTILAAIYAANGGTLNFEPGDWYFNNRIVLPNSAGGSYVGAIGSASPIQPFFRLTGSARSASGTAGTRLFLAYQTGNATSTTVSGPITAGSSVAISGLSIPQGTFDKGCPVTLNDGTYQESATITAITLSGSTITAITLDTLVLSYTGTVTISWPILNDAKIVTLGNGDVEIDRLTLQSNTANDVTPFILCTQSRPEFHHLEIRGWRGPTSYPGLIHTLQAPTQGGIILGGPRAAWDGSPSCGYAGYGGRVERNIFFGVERPIVTQSLFTTTVIRSNYVTGSCGSLSALAAPISSWTAAGPPNNNVTIADNQLEPYQYQQTIRLGNNVSQYHVTNNQQPDNIIATNLNASSAAAATSLVLKGYLPTISKAPFLRSWQFAVETGSVTDLVRFTAMTAATSTTLASGAAAGATTITVASNTGMSVGLGLLIDPGTYGGVPGATGVQEPAYITAISGTTITLATPLAYAHNNAASVQVGPFTATLQAAATYAHTNNALVSPTISGTRLDVGSVDHVILMGATNLALGVRDLNATAKSTVIGAQLQDGASNFPRGIVANAVPLPLTSQSSVLGANVNIDGTVNVVNTWADGPSLSLAAGTWLLTGMFQLWQTVAASNVSLAIWNGTTFYAQDDWQGSIGRFDTQTLQAVVTLGSTTTVKMSFQGSAANTRLSATSAALGNPGATKLLAIRIG